MSTAAKIGKALESKEDIRSAIESVSGSDPGYKMSEYAPIIRTLSNVKTVNNKGPDANGNIQLTSADLGISATVENENLTLIF